ncbi:hypothetical protein [Candidatus Minimicrobia naudis]
MKSSRLIAFKKSGARFDEQRLIWLNGQWIRSLSLDDLYSRCQPFWGEESKNADESYKKRVLELAQDRLKTLQDLPKLTSYFFVEPEIDTELIDGNKQLRKLTDDERRDFIVNCSPRIRENYRLDARNNSELP